MRKQGGEDEELNDIPSYISWGKGGLAQILRHRML